MASFTLFDLLAFAWFLGAWLGYSLLIEKTAKGRSGLNALMNTYRDAWMERLLARDMRMVDAQVTAALQNGTAFFASTSLIAIGGTLTLLRSTDQILTLVAALPFGVPQSQEMWQVKIMGLAIIFVYAFFKFAWSYRLFNYFAIMVGAAPPPAEKDTPAAQDFAHRAARLCADAGRHFNRGQRAFFFALGYLGWFLGPIELVLTTTGIVIVTWRRQFASDARLAFSETRPAPPTG
jgi:uncharacterized membrane protein